MTFIQQINLDSKTILLPKLQNFVSVSASFLLWLPAFLFFSQVFHVKNLKSLIKATESSTDSASAEPLVSGTKNIW